MYQILALNCSTKNVSDVSLANKHTEEYQYLPKLQVYLRQLNYATLDTTVFLFLIFGNRAFLGPFCKCFGEISNMKTQQRMAITIIILRLLQNIPRSNTSLLPEETLTKNPFF